MFDRPGLRSIAQLMLLVAVAMPAGCKSHQHYHESPPVATPPQPLGYGSDPHWQMQERNGEASDFVIYDHEFTGETFRLNRAGRDHVKQIANRLRQGAPFTVIIERATNSVRPDTVYHYPVHNDPQLDLQRREVVARALAAMGVADASQRVVVGPAIAEGIEASEAERAYRRGLISNQSFFGNGAFNAFGRGGFFGRGAF